MHPGFCAAWRPAAVCRLCCRQLTAARTPPPPEVAAALLPGTAPRCNWTVVHGHKERCAPEGGSAGCFSWEEPSSGGGKKEAGSGHAKAAHAAPIVLFRLLHSSLTPHCTPAAGQAQYAERGSGSMHGALCDPTAISKRFLHHIELLLGTRLRRELRPQSMLPARIS